MITSPDGKWNEAHAAGRKKGRCAGNGNAKDLRKKSEKEKKNIENSISRNRKVSIFYLYQNPLIASQFTMKREKVEGRNIPKQSFIDALFNAKNNVQRLKMDYGKNLELHIVIQNFENKAEKTYFNVNSIDSYVKMDYNSDSLKKELPDSILS